MAAWVALSRRTRHWIHLGSAAVYKNKDVGFPNESDPIGGAPTWGKYGVEKSEADEFLIAQAAEVPVTILRPPYLYGPRNSSDRGAFVWARMLQNRPVIVPGDGRTPIQFLHIRDLVSAILLVIEEASKAPAVYNVAADERRTLAEWVAVAAEAGGFPDPSVLASACADRYEWRDYFPFRDSALCVETSRIRNSLGWRPQYSLVAGLRQTLATLDCRDLRAKILNTQIEEKIFGRLSRAT
jgi:nucleoside-diphosphate-sugar epimerase